MLCRNLNTGFNHPCFAGRVNCAVQRFLSQDEALMFGNILAATAVLCAAATTVEARSHHHHHYRSHHKGRPHAWCGWFMRGQVGSDPVLHSISHGRGSMTDQTRAAPRSVSSWCGAIMWGKLWATKTVSGSFKVAMTGAPRGPGPDPSRARSHSSAPKPERPPPFSSMTKVGPKTKKCAPTSFSRRNPWLS